MTMSDIDDPCQPIESKVAASSNVRFASHNGNWNSIVLNIANPPVTQDMSYHQPYVVKLGAFSLAQEAFSNLDDREKTVAIKTLWLSTMSRIGVRPVKGDLEPGRVAFSPTANDADFKFDLLDIVNGIADAAEICGMSLVIRR